MPRRHVASLALLAVGLASGCSAPLLEPALLRDAPKPAWMRAPLERAPIVWRTYATPPAANAHGETWRRLVAERGDVTPVSEAALEALGAARPAAIQACACPAREGAPADAHAACPSWSIAPLELAVLFWVAMPDGSWPLPDAIRPAGDGVRVGQTEEAHARLARIHRAFLERYEEPLSVRVVAVEVPATSLGALGPVQRLGGADGAPAFARVPLRPEAAARVEELARSREGQPRLDVQLEGGAGRWTLARDGTSRAYIEDVDLGRVTDVRLGRVKAGLRLSLLALPLDGSTLLALTLEDTQPIDGPSFVSRARGGNTEVPLEMPAWVTRRGRDAVVLEPGDRLALLSGGRSPDLARIIVIEVASPPGR